MYSEWLGPPTGFGSLRSKVSGPFEARPVPLWGSRLRDLSLARSVTGRRLGPAGGVEEARYQGLPRPGLSLGWGVAASGTCPCSTLWRSFGCIFLIVNYETHITHIPFFRVEAEEAATGCAQTCPPALSLALYCVWRVESSVSSLLKRSGPLYSFAWAMYSHLY